MKSGDPIEILTDKIELNNLFMDFDRYSQVIINIIKGTKSNFSIGIYGEWGIGKTTLMRQIEENLNKENDVLTVWFNAWRYERENQYAIVSLLKTIAYEMDKSSKYNKVKQIIIKSIATITKGVIEKYIFTEKTTAELRKNFVSQMKELAEADKDTIYFDGIRKIENALNEIRNEFPDQRVVVFIDDLDRCSPIRALEVFESIKVFLDIDGFVYVIGLSHETISKLISAAYKETEIDGEQYIRKIIQIPILVPDWNNCDIEDFIENVLSNKLNNKYSSLIKENKKLISIAVEPNPREVKRFINNFIISHEIYSANPNVKSNHILILQALRTRYSNFYKHFLLNEKFRNIALDLLNFSYDIMIKLFDRSLLDKLIENKIQEITNLQKRRATAESNQINTLDDQINNLKKEINNLNESYEKINKLDDDQWKSISIKDRRLWVFLKEQKETLLEIKEWEIYRRAIETTKDLFFESKDKRLDSSNPFIKSGYITIDSTPLLGKDGDILTMSYDRFATIQDLLDTIWAHALRDTDIPPYRYVRMWLLKDAESGRILNDIGIGSQYGLESPKYETDVRSLKDVGIYPGKKLLIIPAN